MNLDANLELFRYDVNIEPKSESVRALQNRRKRRQFFKVLFNEANDFRARAPGIATDYANTLITRGRLFDKKFPVKIYHQIYRGEYELARRPNDPPRDKDQVYLVTVKFQSLVSISEIFRYIESKPTDVSDFTTMQDAIQALNIIMAGTPNKNAAVFQSGQNKFYQYPRNETNLHYAEAYGTYDLSGSLIAVRGYYSSIRTSTNRILLNVNAQCSPFYPELNLLRMIKLLWNSVSNRHELEDFINKLRVRTEYTMEGNKRVIKVMTVRGFSHPWVADRDSKGKERFNKDGSTKMKGTKGVDHDWGTSDSVRINTTSPARSLTVTQYFKESKVFLMCRREAIDTFSSPSDYIGTPIR